MQKHSSAMILDNGEWIGSVYQRADGKYYALNYTGARWQLGDCPYGATPSNNLHPNQLTHVFQTETALRRAFIRSWRSYKQN